MSNVEKKDKLTNEIKLFGDQIRDVKVKKGPKEEWEPLLKQMQDLKIQYEEVTGEKYDSSDKESKKSKSSKGEGQQEASEKNKEKNALKAQKKKEKEAKKEANRRLREQREREKALKLAGVGEENYGELLVDSKAISNKKWTKISSLNKNNANGEYLVRASIQVSRGVGKGLFLLLRSGMYSIQGVCFENESSKISREMIRYMINLPLESVVDVKGELKVSDDPVTSATQSDVEIHIVSCHCISTAVPSLPVTFDDACRREEEGGVTVGQDMRLNNRWIDLRTPANQAIFRIQSTITSLFREYLSRNDFIEVHTPKLIGGASEGGSDVFELDYFSQKAFLAMSPQLHKQILASSSGFERVYEIGPVFRAEDSNTRRHLCEFTGLDFEMTINEHYDEILNVFSELFIFIFENIKRKCAKELELIREQYPFEDIEFCKPTLRLTYPEGCALLQQAGIDQDPHEDLSTENEKKLGDIVKEKYHTDFFFMDKYPLCVRPFYTMPDPNDPKRSNSYDFFLRGQEILSGAQRIHVYELLVERAKAKEIPLQDLGFYLRSFQHGAMPHGGGGIGLERLLMLFLDLKNIRKATLFTRDPKRLSP